MKDRVLLCEKKTKQANKQTNQLNKINKAKKKSRNKKEDDLSGFGKVKAEITTQK